MTHTKYNNTKSMLIVGSIVTLSMLAFVSPASADRSSSKSTGSNTSSVTVSTENNAFVLNEVVVVASTGNNNIDGGNTGRAGNGGDAKGSRANAGDGGTSGSSSNDGAIGTGDATAIGTVQNDINSNRTNVTIDCGCVSKKGKNDKNSDKLVVWTGNNAVLANGLAVAAETGNNDIDGGTTGKAGNGGDATSNDNKSKDKRDNKKNSTTGAANAGNGGNTGSTDNYGTIVTGDSLSDGLVVNVVNRNVTRVAR